MRRFQMIFGIIFSLTLFVVTQSWAGLVDYERMQRRKGMPSNTLRSGRLAESPRAFHAITGSMGPEVGNASLFSGQAADWHIDRIPGFSHRLRAHADYTR